MNHGRRSLNLIDLKAEPALSSKELRKFALTVGATIAILFGFVLPWLFGKGWVLWPCLIGGALILWGLVHPSSLGPVYAAWMRLGVILNKIVSPLVLGSIFFLMFSPIAIVLKILKKKMIDTEFEPSVSSYRTLCSKESAANYERPF